jgi:hypothetical protein
VTATLRRFATMALSWYVVTAVGHLCLFALVITACLQQADALVCVPYYGTQM